MTLYKECGYNNKNMKEYVESSVNNLRKKMNITQEDLAKNLGITRQTVIAIEKGNYTPSLILAFKISRFFKKPIEQIFSYINEK